jgi:hypothetical protein
MTNRNDDIDKLLSRFSAKQSHSTLPSRIDSMFYSLSSWGPMLGGIVFAVSVAAMATANLSLSGFWEGVVKIGSAGLGGGVGLFLGCCVNKGGKDK